MATATRSTRPAAAAAEEPVRPKQVSGVHLESLVEERQPLLDANDTREARDLPPPPASATISQASSGEAQGFASAAPSKAVTRSTATSDAAIASLNATARDFRALYSEEEERRETYSSMYPELVPTAPCQLATDSQRAGVVTASSSAPPAAAVHHEEAPARPQAALAAPLSAEESASQQVVEELLAENERLKLLVEEMQERERSGVPSIQQPSGLAYPGAASWAVQQGRRQQQQQQALARQHVRGPQTRLVNQGGGAVLVQQPSIGTVTSQPTAIKHFRCPCTQFLQVPVQAELVYCPTCGHTSRATNENTFLLTVDTPQAPQAARREEERETNQPRGLLSCVRGLLY